jgi:peptidoglycan/LPS O-acetylase OafA/YrhL
MAGLRSLHGLSAVSIGLVLWGHTCGTEHLLPRNSLVRFDRFDVWVFFVISGFRITMPRLEKFKRVRADIHGGTPGGAFLG